MTMYELVIDSYGWDREDMDHVLKTLNVKSNSIVRCMKVVSLNDTDFYTFILKDDRFFTIGFSETEKTPVIYKASWLKM